MRDFFIESFSDYSRIIIFLHVISAALLIGSMFTVRFVIHPIQKEISDMKIRFENCMKMVERYMLFSLPMMFFIIATSVFMHIGLGFRGGNPLTNVMVHTKEALWTFIAFNMLYMYLKYRRAQKGMVEENYIEVEENVVLIVRYLIPLNLLLAAISGYFGVILRGF
ncbi:hypothetical protein [Sulfurospirillum deleyianum]|uniref:Integral membrane protein n=1 Tax=Sulfurospirillum deleyianum (strain ATCC 51133 / DSM 6946 / 5175) TaxID=525898 RepID=D1B3L1_SULD5|nr:hypothetical protein [Sulfurospirillum deleyianum]ACZ12681.1 conserved hypothetical protein [Sulfurospirillum deleyianum DSM 6946]